MPIPIPNPFPENDPRHARWLECARIVWEMDTRRQANLLRRMASTPDEQLHTLFVPAAVERFDLPWKLFIEGVTTYEEAAFFEETLRKSSARVYQWFRGFLDKRSPRASRGDLLGDLRVRLEVFV